MKYITLAFFVLNCLMSFAQHKSGFKISGGISQMVQQNPDLLELESDDWISPGFTMGYFNSHYFTEHSGLDIEVTLSMLSGGSEITYNSPWDDGTTLQDFYVRREYTRTGIYFDIPISYSFTWKRLSFLAGFKTSITLASSEKEKYNFRTNGPLGALDYAEGELNTIDFGPRFNILLYFFKKMALDVGYYHGLTNISSSNFPEKVNIRYFTFGFRFAYIKEE